MLVLEGRVLIPGTSTIEAMMTCPKCGHLCELEDYIVNFGWCSPCLDESFELYIESVAGPDWPVAA